MPKKKPANNKSGLPYWITTKLPDGKLGLQCPRTDCGGKCVVNKKKWTAPRTYQMQGKVVKILGRSCTYCFKANAIPDDLIK